MKPTLVYIFGDLDRSLGMEWTLNGLRNEGYKIETILLFQPERKSHFEEFLKQHHFSFRRLSLSSKWKMVFLFIQLWQLLRQLKKQHGQLVVHTHGYVPSVLGIIAAYWAGISSRVITRHHGDYHQRYGHSFHARIDRWLNKIASHIIAISPMMEEYLVKVELAPAEKVVYIPHGFDIDFFQTPDPATVEQLRLTVNPNLSYPVIGVIARWIEYKGIQYVIPAFQRLLAEYPEALLVLANAQGVYEPQILKFLSELPKQNYYRLKFTPYSPELYSSLNIIVHTPVDAKGETFGQVYIEAMAAGVPGVFSASGIASEFLQHMQNAYVVPFRDSDAIYEGMKTILADRELRRKLIANGFETAQEFSMDKQIVRLNACYMGLNGQRTGLNNC